MWQILIPVITQYGLPFAQKIWEKWTSGANPTPQDWADLTAMSQQTALSQMKSALARAGIPETDPHAVALLAQVPT